LTLRKGRGLAFACSPLLVEQPGKLLHLTRWFESARESHHDPVWETGKGGA
jgi:hypothetical protein